MTGPNGKDGLLGKGLKSIATALEQGSWLGSWCRGPSEQQRCKKMLSLLLLPWSTCRRQSMYTECSYSLSSAPFPACSTSAAQLHVWAGLPLQVSISRPPVSLPSGWTPDAHCSSVQSDGSAQSKKPFAYLCPDSPPLEGTAVISRRQRVFQD
jgi:hypothetical protein